MTLQYSTALRNLMLGADGPEICPAALSGCADLAQWTSTDTTDSISSGRIRLITAGYTTPSQTGYVSAGGKIGSPHATLQDIVRGHIYKISFDYINETANTCSVSVYNKANDALIWTSGVLSATTLTNFVGYFRMPTTVVADNAITLRLEQLTATTTYCEFDNISVKDVSKSFTDIFGDCHLLIMSGTQPTANVPANLAAADQAHGSILATITKTSGTASGLDWDTIASATAQKPTGDTWSGSIVGANTASWFRLCRRDDPGSVEVSPNFYWPRLDGSVGTSGANLNLSSTNFQIGGTAALTQFSLVFPASSLA